MYMSSHQEVFFLFFFCKSYGGGTVKSTLILFAYSLARKLAVSVVSKPNQVRKLSCRLSTYHIMYMYIMCAPTNKQVIVIETVVL